MIRSENIEIRKIQEKEIKSTYNFFSLLLQNTFLKTFPVKAIKKAETDFSEENLHEFINCSDRVLLGAFHENTIHGIMFGSRLNGGIASVVWIGVDENLRGCGIGCKLMKETFKRYSKLGAHKIVLYTETEKAKKFYEKIGMRQEGFHQKHWWTIDHFCYAKFLL